MRLFKPRNVQKQRRFRLLTLLMMGIAAVVVAGFVRESVRSRQIDRQISELKAESEKLRAKNFEIASMRSSLGQTEAVEKEARLKLGLQKAGERVVVIRPAPVAAVLDPAPSIPAEKIPNARKWWLYFMDKETLQAYGPGRTETQIR